jgi:hypothetical protein
MSCSVASRLFDINLAFYDDPMPLFGRLLWIQIVHFEGCITTPIRRTKSFSETPIAVCIHARKLSRRVGKSSFERVQWLMVRSVVPGCRISSASLRAFQRTIEHQAIYRPKRWKADYSNTI